MLKLNEEQRALLSEKIADVANLTFGALVVGHALGGRPFSIGGMVTGSAFWVAGIAFAIRIRRGAP